MIEGGAWRWINDSASLLKQKLSLDSLIHHDESYFDVLAIFIFFSSNSKLNLLNLMHYYGLFLHLTDPISIKEDLRWIARVLDFECLKRFSHHPCQLRGNFLILSLLDVCWPILVEVAIHSCTKSEVWICLCFVEHVITTYHCRLFFVRHITHCPWLSS